MAELKPLTWPYRGRMRWLMRNEEIRKAKAKKKPAKKASTSPAGTTSTSS